MPDGLPLLFGPYGSGALDHSDLLAAYDANACWLHMFDEGAFETCARRGLAACVEFKTFRAGVQAFRPAGIWLDYLTYSGWFEVPDPDLQESCFCPACVAAFCEATGIDAPTAAEILARHAGAWTRHKCARIAGFAARYAQIIRTRLPGCVIGAYMCPWTPAEFDGALSRIFGQDYALLAPAIDVFTPLIYSAKSGRPAAWGRAFLEAALAFVPADRKVQLILDALDGPASLVETADAALPSWGLQVFDGATVFADAAFARVFQAAVARIRADVAERQALCGS